MEFYEKYLNDSYVAPIRIGGEKICEGEIKEVTSPFSGKVVGRTYSANREMVIRAVDVASTFHKTSNYELVERTVVLDKASEKIKQYREDFARMISSESAKPIATARIEVDRAIETFKFSAVSARTLVGEMVAIDAHPKGINHTAFTIRVPIGVVAAIAPFNFPLNLVSHKVAPAIAAGCPIVLKPATNTPLTSCALVDLLIDECGLDPNMLSYVPCTGSVANVFTELDDVAMISFTGSQKVGWTIRESAPKKKVALELGNNAPVILEPDCDIENVAGLMAKSGTIFAGQNCVSVQRIYVHSDIKEKFVESLKDQFLNLKVGDPLEDDTDVSSLITKKDNSRVKKLIDDAVNEGAKLIVGGDEDKNEIFLPTILLDTTDDMEVCANEVFGPVICVMEYSNFDEALKRANNTTLGLQAGVFTNNLQKAMKAARTLDFGGVCINETPTYRADNMPYGGVNDSGNTKEGPAYTVKEMTNERLIIINES